MKKCALFLSFLPLLMGCSLFAVLGSLFTSEDVIDPSIPVEDKKIAVIPFGDDLFQPFESERGKKLAYAIVADVENNRDYTSLEKIFVAESDDLSRHFEFYRDNIRWDKVAELAKADWVVCGKIVEFRTQGKRHVGIYQGRAEVEFWVYDRKQKKKILTKTVTTYYPSQVETAAISPGVSDEEIALRIERGLIRKLARLVGREFYSYSVDPHRRGGE